MSFLNYIRWFFFWCKTAQRVPRPEWTDDDARHLENFLKTPTGRKWQQLMESETAAHDHWALMQIQNLPHAAGWARGFSAAHRLTETLSQATAQRGEHEADAAGADIDFEQRYAP